MPPTSPVRYVSLSMSKHSDTSGCLGSNVLSLLRLVSLAPWQMRMTAELLRRKNKQAIGWCVHSRKARTGVVMTAMMTAAEMTAMYH